MGVCQDAYGIVQQSNQRLMEICLGDKNFELLLIYLDAILIFSKSFEEHLHRLDFVLGRLEANNLKIKPSKCESEEGGKVPGPYCVCSRSVNRPRENPSSESMESSRHGEGITWVFRISQLLQAICKRICPDSSTSPYTFDKDGPQSKKSKMKQSLRGVWMEDCQQSFDTLKEKLRS